MSVVTSQPEIKVLSFSCVMIWSKIVGVPALDPTVARGLFDKPATTHIAIDGNGLTIAELHSVQPVKKGDNGFVFTFIPVVKPQVTIGPQRYTNTAPTLAEVLENHEKLKALFDKVDPTFVSNLATNQLGINIECDLNFGDKFSATKWLEDKFGLNKNGFGFKKIIPNQFQFTIVEEQLNKLTVVIVEPRSNNDHSVFIKINDHFGISPISDYGNSSELKAYFEKSIEKISNQIIPLLLID